jgi:hypothetical protein
MSKKLLFVALVALSMIMVSCAKQEGCTDPKASNYSADADKDDGSCTYSGELTMWWRQSFQDSCASYGISSANLYVDNVFKGNLALGALYFNSQPSCGANGTLTSAVNFGTAKSKTVVLKYELLSGTTNLGTVEENYTVGTGCNAYELTW